MAATATGSPTGHGQERERTRQVFRKKQRKARFLMNPRYIADRTDAENGKPCPFAFTPETVIFRDYQVGGVYEIPVDLRNTADVGRRLRVIPCANPSFAIGPIQYEGEGTRPQPFSVVAPGMSAHLTVMFAPQQLNDETDELIIATELGDYKLPIKARRFQPRLEYREPVDCGYTLAGNILRQSLHVTNRGGEGSFRLILAEATSDSGDYSYESDEDGETRFVSSSFTVTPATFYLEANQTVDLRIAFASNEVGRHRLALLVEGDNGTRTPLTLLALTDALRLEVSRWPGLPQTLLQPCPVDLQRSPWAMLPWQLSWQSPGAQVGCAESQTIAVSNGGYLPASVQWRFARPPTALLSRLAVGAQQRLTEDILCAIHQWEEYPEEPSSSSLDCPFTVSPKEVTIPSFSAAQFTFTFHAHPPVAHRVTSFAYLVATEMPASRHCLLRYNKMVELQASMQPEGYQKGLPLFGGAVSTFFDRQPVQVGSAGAEQNAAGEIASCAITAVCLQGLTAAPSLVCPLRLLAFPGDLLPFLSHTKELTVRNTGPRPAYFRVRLSPDTPAARPGPPDQLWVVAPQEVRRKTAASLRAARPPEMEYSVALEKSEAALLGVEVEDDRERLVVRAIGSGLVEEWNRAHPHAQVTKGDEISEANGKSVTAGKLSELYDGLARGEKLVLQMRRANAEYLRLAAEHLAAASPPLPEQTDPSKPGYGALATAAVEPAEGVVQPGQSVNLRVTLRALRECNISSRIFLDFPVGPHNKAVAAPTVDIAVMATIRSPRVELRGASFLDYGVVRAHARHTVSLQVDNASDLPMLVQLRHLVDGAATAPPAFPVTSHQEVVDFFIRGLRAGGSMKGFGAMPSAGPAEARVDAWVHARSGCLERSGRRKYLYQHRRDAAESDSNDEERPEDSEDVPFQAAKNRYQEPRKPVEGGTEEGHLSDSVDFIFQPACMVLWPRQRAQVEVTLRTSEVGKYHALFEAMGFDSAHTQCIQASADVQLPRLRLSTQRAHFPVTYVKTPSPTFGLQIFNESDMPADFRWHVPAKAESGLEVQIEPRGGSLPPRGELGVTLVAVPAEEAKLARLECKLHVGDALLPLVLQVSARVYGLEVDYAIVPAGELPPSIHLQPRELAEPSSVSFEVSTGRAPKSAGIIDFGELELQHCKSIQLVLFNRSGIPTTWAAKVENFPSCEPVVKAKKPGGLEAMRMSLRTFGHSERGGSMQDSSKMLFRAEPQPAAQGRGLGKEADAVADGTLKSSQASLHSTGEKAFARTGSARFDPKSRRSTSPAAKKAAATKRKKFLLDDKHEKQAFRSNIGAEFAQVKELREQGTVALQYGQGWAVRVEPSTDSLQPFGTAVITLTCFSDLPGPMEDELVLSVRQLRGHAAGGDFRIPVRVLSKGNPLYLPDLQVGLNRAVDPPQLLCGTMVPAEKVVTKPFKVCNNSAAKMRISWKVYGSAQVNHREEGRRYVNLALCGRPGGSDPFAAASGSPGGSGELEADPADAQRQASSPDVASEALGEEEEEEPPFQFKMWTEEPPEVKDPFALPDTGELPLRIEPEEAVLPAHGSAMFNVVLVASRPTITADGHYRYKLVGKGRFTEDREALLAEAMRGYREQPPRVEVTARLPSRELQVRELPAFAVEGVDDDDSDAEPSRERESEGAMLEDATMWAREATRSRSSVAPPRPLQQEPEQDVVSMLVIDCVGDVIIPRLSVDKKDDEGAEDFPFLDPTEIQLDGSDPSKPLPCPMFKFTHSAVAHPAAARTLLSGTMHGGAAGGAQIPGVAACLVRNVTLSNRNACSLVCRFRVEGPFRILEVSQVGQFPVKIAEPASKTRKKAAKLTEQEPSRVLYTVAKWETVTLQVEFVPELVPASAWTETQITHVFEGQLVVEYPRETADVPGVPADLQRIRLVGVSRRPAVRVVLVPQPNLDRGAPAVEAQGVPLLVEFGRVHVETSLTRRRVVLLLNETNVLARWQLAHVGRKRKGSDPGVAREEEDASALDDRDAFDFDVCSGELRGPSKDVLVPGSTVRMPRWLPVTPALPHSLPSADEHLFEPLRVTISFRPKKNELYRCRFRFKVESGISADIICRGYGSYSEEDDEMDFLEA